MKAMQFIVSIPRYLLTKAIRVFYSPISSSHPACLQYREVIELELPNEEWAKIKVKYAGICGSDMSLIYLHDSPFAPPFISSSLTIGHENLGTILELRDVDGTPIWLNELEVKGSFACSTEAYQGQQLCTYHIALNLMAEGKLDLASLITHKFNRADYEETIETTASKVKTDLLKQYLSLMS